MDELETKLAELFTRFCYRNGRHGETYLLEEGLRKGLTVHLLQLFKSERTKAKEEVLRVALAQQRQDLKEQVMEAIGKDEKEGKHARCAYKFTGMEWYCDDHEIRDFPNEFNGDSVTRNKLRAEQRKRIEAIFEKGGELIIKNESK